MTTVRVVDLYGNIHYLLESYFLENTIEDLNDLQNVRYQNYLHNLEGPALTLLTNRIVYYYIMGVEQKTKEHWEEAVLIYNFNNKLADVLND